MLRTIHNILYNLVLYNLVLYNLALYNLALYIYDKYIMIGAIILSVIGGVSTTYAGYLCYNRYKQKQLENYKGRAYYNIEHGYSGLYPQYEPLQTNINNINLM